MEGSSCRKFSFSRGKGVVLGTGPRVLRNGEPGFLLAGILRTGVPSSGDQEATVLPGETFPFFLARSGFPFRCLSFMFRVPAPRFRVPAPRFRVPTPGYGSLHPGMGPASGLQAE
ncbi:hypothetical protein F2Q69_00022705 [Brassica cretica]|uniref:Uncharacterized protein n=1 Tax=Brassica cretica TaxID=69181 RepID=A0A8S9QLW0_BRACR|nr:hypothetical protein F2Q69_00022705 [Brassica cretica]